MVKEHSKDLIDLEVNEHGSPVMFARGFAATAVDQLEYIASISRGIMGQVLPQSMPNAVGYLQRVPIGVCGGARPTTPPLNKGYFLMPTAVADCAHDMTIA